MAPPQDVAELCAMAGFVPVASVGELSSALLSRVKQTIRAMRGDNNINFQGLHSCFEQVLAVAPGRSLSPDELLDGLRFAARAVVEGFSDSTEGPPGTADLKSNELAAEVSEKDSLFAPHFSEQLPVPTTDTASIRTTLRVSRWRCLQIVAGGFFGVLHRPDRDGSQKLPKFTFDELWAYDCRRWKTKNLVLSGVLVYFAISSKLGRDKLVREDISIIRKAVNVERRIADDAWTKEFCPLDLRQDKVSIHDVAGSGNSATSYEFFEADFANSFLGGAVLKGFGAQEESLFLECPELIASLFLVQRMLPHEAVEIRQAHKCVDHNMIRAEKARWEEQYCRPAAESVLVEKCSVIVALDAQNFNSHGMSRNQQYRWEQILREVTKCSAALVPPQDGCPGGARRTFVSGNWGTGCFRGDLELKFVIQWACCSLEGSVERMVYCPWDQRHALVNAGLEELREAIEGRKVSVGKVLGLLQRNEYRTSSNTFRYLLERL